MGTVDGDIENILKIACMIIIPMILFVLALSALCYYIDSTRYMYETEDLYTKNLSGITGNCLIWDDYSVTCVDNIKNFDLKIGSVYQISIDKYKRKYLDTKYYLDTENTKREVINVRKLES